MRTTRTQRDFSRIKIIAFFAQKIFIFLFRDDSFCRYLIFFLSPAAFFLLAFMTFYTFFITLLENAEWNGLIWRIHCHYVLSIISLYSRTFSHEHMRWPQTIGGEGDRNRKIHCVFHYAYSSEGIIFQLNLNGD